MGGTIEYVYRDGSRLTPWMLYVINRASAELFERFGEHLLVTSGIRTNAEQTSIFVEKYRAQSSGNGPYGDVRWWNGKRYVRVVGGGTVAPPGKSNHEIQRSKAAVDLRDTGRDAGVATGGNARANWLRANASRLGLIASGYGFGEPWHYDIPDIFRTPPATPGAAGGNATPIIIPADVPEEEDEDMSRNILYKTIETGAKYPIRAAVTNDTSGLWIEFVDNQAGTMNTLADRYQTGDAVEVTGSMFSAVRDAAARVRPQSNLAVKVGTPEN